MTGPVVYQMLFHAVLRHTDAERIHGLSAAALRGAAALPGVPAAMARLLGAREPELRVRALGREFAGPLGMAAGFDKDARLVDGLAALGFGHVEIGTVTAEAQPGNPRPRLFRLTADRAIVNRMGFNNEGSAAVAERLRARARRRRPGPRVVVGANIGKTKAVREERAVEDYVTSARRFADVADYVAVNVSSPNTPGLRDLQAVGHLRPLLSAVRAALDEAGRPELPLLVKIAPDLADSDVDAVADLALELGLHGIIATNTTIAREGLATPADEVAAAGAGGLSGAPLKDRSLEVLTRLRARVGDRLVLVAVGGVETPEDAWARIRAGATLVQGYTGLVYNGPLWPRRMHRGLARLVRAAGYRSVTDAVGSDLAAQDRAAS
ncbi:quinone-dependent dihydroorotate dehydrogenase [Marinitenerispora sediminis]|uniref:Dihydroorotate dehydrogenase (quinone) n=1 Tax=Marinitenerispora sediminis TaxID=1931232 RepID=A0A368T107_9ACTN|nr:quinone-dependent dihydroorotate dehydrogenase [Marinitenerispora sediminis]RCV50228.1 dihydroorotate dehydrogenase (quinone) [Marinitenerispora sediminis]RCV53499.1 dihydroorotate dehydrogenase (quinone) [Marinitenerispora sediminis]RCV54566.1 dihydroorotate dehydrogenase (quinone) [Marinitenerispora sediminis]